MPWSYHNDVIKRKQFPRYWPFERGFHRWPVNSPYNGQWHGALVFSLICAWINGWVNTHDAGNLRRHRAHYNVTVMVIFDSKWNIRDKKSFQLFEIAAFIYQIPEISICLCIQSLRTYREKARPISRSWNIKTIYLYLNNTHGPHKIWMWLCFHRSSLVEQNLGLPDGYPSRKWRSTTDQTCALIITTKMKWKEIKKSWSGYRYSAGSITDMGSWRCYWDMLTHV